MTALLEDGYEGQELYNALSVVLPGLEPDALNQYYDAWLEAQLKFGKKDSRNYLSSRCDERVVERSSDFSAFRFAVDGVAVVSAHAHLGMPAF